MVNTSLIVACVGLAFGIAVLAIAIVALVYGVATDNPAITLGNITTGSLTANGPLSTTQSTTVTGTTTSGSNLNSNIITINGNASVLGLVDSTVSTANPLITTNGTNASSPTVAAIVNSGGIGASGSINIAQSLHLPNIATGLSTGVNYYEEFTLITTLSGPWVAQSWTMYIIRKGNNVTALWSGASGTATIGAFITSAAVLPARFYNSAYAQVFNSPCSVQNNTVFQIGQFRINMGSGVSTFGTISFTADATGTALFAGSGTASVLEGTASWTLN